MNPIKDHLENIDFTNCDIFITRTVTPIDQICVRSFDDFKK